MPQPITIPRLGWSMERGIFSGWLKTAGDSIREGDALFLLEGDKATHEVEALDAGVLCIPADAPELGVEVAVGQVIGFLLAANEPPPTSVGLPPSAGVPDISSVPDAGRETFHGHSLDSPAPYRETNSPARAAGPAARRLARQLGLNWQHIATPDPTGRILTQDVLAAAALTPAQVSSPTTVTSRFGGGAHAASPRARRRAASLGVDWRQANGTGRNGRVRERDVMALSQQARQSRLPVPSLAPEPLTAGHHRPASKIRQVIAQRMVAGCQQAAPVTLTTRVDAQPLIDARAALADAELTRPSYQDLIIYLTSRLLREQPEMNACWYREGIWTYEAVHIAFAAETPHGLLAPVIEHADQKTWRELATISQDLIHRARAGQLTEKQLSGGTFTVSNLGAYGIDGFTPVLNLPQAGILGVGRIVTEPVVRQGELCVGQTLTLSLTFDHRVLDGAPAARWLQRLGQRLAEITGELGPHSSI